MTATCLHCRRTFTRKGHMLVGQNEMQKLGDLGQVLTEHLQTVHPEKLAEGTKLIMAMSGLAVFSNFRCSDPYFVQERNNAARDIRTSVSRVVTDADLENFVTKRFVGSWTVTDVFEFLKHMRDYLNYSDAEPIEPPEAPPSIPTLTSGGSPV